MSKNMNRTLLEEIAFLSGVVGGDSEQKNLSNGNKSMRRNTKIPLNPTPSNSNSISTNFSRSKPNSKYSINNVKPTSTNNKYKYSRTKTPTKTSIPLHLRPTSTSPSKPGHEYNFKSTGKYSITINNSTTTTATILNKSKYKYSKPKINSPSTSKYSGNTFTTRIRRTSLKLRAKYSIDNNKKLVRNKYKYVKANSQSPKTPRRIRTSSSSSATTKSRPKYFFINKYSLAKYYSPKRPKLNFNNSKSNTNTPKKRIKSKYAIINNKTPNQTPKSTAIKYKYSSTPLSSGRLRSVSNSSTTLELRMKYSSINKSQNSRYKLYKSKYSPRNEQLKKQRRKSIKELIKMKTSRYYDTKESNTEDKQIVSMIVPRRLPQNPYIDPNEAEDPQNGVNGPDGEAENGVCEADSNSKTTNAVATEDRRQRLLSKLSDFKNRFNQLKESESRSSDFIPFKKS